MPTIFTSIIRYTARYQTKCDRNQCRSIWNFRIWISANASTIMDQMLPSPGFSLGSLGTPMQQLDEDPHMIGNNPYYASPNMMSHPTTGLTPAGMGSTNDGGGGVGSSGLSTNIDTDLKPLPLPLPLPTPPVTTAASTLSSGLPSLLGTPARASSYQPSYATPHSMMQPQTPVKRFTEFMTKMAEAYVTI